MTEFTPAPIPDGKREIDGKIYIGDGKGACRRSRWSNRNIFWKTKWSAR